MSFLSVKNGAAAKRIRNSETALSLLESAGTAGNLTTDAQIAAVALRLDAEVHAADLDFGRFLDVRFSNPLV
jgi:predicted nucleic acid-binding protein